MPEIQKGDALPGFTLKNQFNDEINSLSWLGAPVVVYFYPRDNTPICTAQACSFRNRYDEFQDLGVKVVGISYNDSNSHAKFAEKHSLPYTLLSDKKNEVRKLFGVPKSLLGMSAGRVTYVFDGKGKLIYVHNAFLQAKEHVQAALDSLKKNK